LEILNLSKNQIKRIENLTPQQNLRELNLAYNQIENIFGLDQIPLLSVINLSYNKIADIKELRNLQNIKSLRILFLEGNPICNHPYFSL